MNKVILIGNLAADPELRQTQSGKDTCTFTLCCGRGSGENKTTDFIRCVAWNETAKNICRFFTKGRKMAIEGSWKTGNYEKDGQKVFTNDCWVERFDFCDFSKEAATAPESAHAAASGRGASTTAAAYDVISDGDLPF